MSDKILHQIKDGVYIGTFQFVDDISICVKYQIQTIICHQISTAKSKQIKQYGIDIIILEKNIFDNYQKLFTFFNIFDKAMHNGQSVLILYQSIESCESVLFVCGYLMKRFRWTLKKAIQYIENIVEQKIENYEKTMCKYENELFRLGVGPKSIEWCELSDKKDYQQILLTNTHLNRIKKQEKNNIKYKEYRSERLIKWADQENRNLTIDLESNRKNNIKK